jgi:carboxyl-terminal processing protease
MTERRLLPQLLWTVFIILFILFAFSSGVVVGWVTPGLKTQLASKYNLPFLVDKTAKPDNMDTLFKPFWETWSVVHKEYFEQPVDDTKLMQGAIRGMLGSLGDPHSSYMDPAEYKSETDYLNGAKYEGIGIWVDTKGDYLMVISPIKGSPAEKANIQAGDMILAVDSKDVSGMESEAVMKLIKGPAGTNVTITIGRKGVEKPFDVTITRSKINTPSVEYKMLDKNIAYIQIFTFGETTGKEVHAALKELLAKKPAGLILDLRNNGGGYLNTAVEVVSEFIPSGKTVVGEQFGSGKKVTLSAQPGGIAQDIPIIVLGNEGTASASEITAGALQDYNRAKLVGVKTYGKGSVQNWMALQNQAGAVKITVAHWLTPNGRQINAKGLDPDVEVKLSEEDIKSKTDTQLNKAIEMMLSGAK